MTDAAHHHDHHRHEPANGVIDPVCGMTVDPHTTQHRHQHHGHTYHFCSAGCRTKFAADPEKYLDKTAARRRAGAGRHDLHLPDASRDPAGRPRLLPDLRDGAGAGACDRRHRPQSRTRRHEPALLDRARADRCRCSRWKWARTSSAGTASSINGSRTGSSSRFATPVVLWAGWPFFVRGWQSRRHAQSQHVHADRDGHRRRLSLQRHRDGRARHFSGRLPRATRARFPSTSRRPRSSPCWCCSDRCWNCARASRPRARSAR